MTRYRVCPGCGHTITGACPRCAPLPGRAGRSPTTRAQRDGTGDYDRHRRLVLRLDRHGAPLPGPRPSCYWCRTAEATTADHVVPVARGGSHRLSNLVPACVPCNSARRDDPDWRPAHARR
jgi:5-methylcytosine-specific restriction endonuclease McrA